MSISTCLRISFVVDAKRSNKSHLGEIKLLVHLRFLAIRYERFSMGSLALIDRLINLEFLIVENCSSVAIPSVIMTMMKLRYVKIAVAIFDKDWYTSQTNNLEYLSSVSITSLNDEEILKCSPHLRILKCNCEALWVEEQGKYRYPNFGFLTQLESLNMSSNFGCGMADISLPSNIKKLALSKLFIPWEKMSIIEKLPNLQVLKLSNGAFTGEIWETRDGEFQQLICLKLQLLNLAQWHVPFSAHFPKLRQIVLGDCSNLLEVPFEIGRIGTLQLVEVKGVCQKSLVESARQLEREQQDMGNDEPRVIFKRICDADTYELILRKAETLLEQNDFAAYFQIQDLFLQ